MPQLPTPLPQMGHHFLSLSWTSPSRPHWLGFDHCKHKPHPGGLKPKTGLPSHPTKSAASGQGCEVFVHFQGSSVLLPHPTKLMNFTFLVIKWTTPLLGILSTMLEKGRQKSSRHFQACMGVLPTHFCAAWACLMSTEAVAGVIEGCEYLVGCWKWNHVLWRSKQYSQLLSQLSRPSLTLFILRNKKK